MKVSVAWLQKYFAEPLPETAVLVDVLTFHSSEVEEVIGDGANAVLDVKVLPDRASYALSHRGIASELAAALDVTLMEDPLRSALPEYPLGSAENAQLRLSIEDEQKCQRYMAARVSGVMVGPSPDWLKAALESLGQRSINNVVDATNYVMLNLGQPLHAFDAAKLTSGVSSTISIAVRAAEEGEKITSLTGEDYALPKGTLLITDGSTRAPLGIAGVKGGKTAEVTSATTELIVEAATFEGSGIRKTSQALKLWTDASLRFQNRLSPELASYGMRDALALILDIAGGTLAGVVDTYPNPEPAAPPVSVTREQLNGILGSDFSAEEISEAFARLGLETVVEGETFSVRPPFERRDIIIWQDLAEEAGRVMGYDRIAPESLPHIEGAPDQRRFKGIELIKDVLVERGFTELSTQAFDAEGSVQLANPLQQERPWLRASLAGNMERALSHATTIAPRTIGPEPFLKLFELGTVFTREGEYLSLCLGYRTLSGKPSAAVLPDAIDALLAAFPAAHIVPSADTGTGVAELSLKDADLEGIGEHSLDAGGQLSTPARIALGPYTPFSLYPSAVRDIAVWTPEGTEESEVSLHITKEAGDYLARIDIFDRFEKPEGESTRTSYAFRLIFQASDRTLNDTDLDPTMARITDALNAQEGWEVR